MFLYYKGPAAICLMYHVHLTVLKSFPFWKLICISEEKLHYFQIDFLCLVKIAGYVIYSYFWPSTFLTHPVSHWIYWSFPRFS